MIAPRPLGIGEIFDRAVTVVVRNWRPIALLCAISALPDVALRLANRGPLPRGGWFLVGIAINIVVGAYVSIPIVLLCGDDAAPRDLRALLRVARRLYARSLASYALIDVLFFVMLGLAAVFVVIAIGVGTVFGRGVAGTIAGVAAGVAILAIVAPVFLALSVAYPTTLLERVGAWQGIALAWSRTLHADLRRAWLFGAAIVVTTLTPLVVFDEALGQLAHVPGLWWAPALEPVLTGVSGVAYATALATVAAVDYRNRREGADLEAALRNAPTS